MLFALRILPFLILLIAMFFYPQEVLTSASMGLSLWVNYVLPALFPFFIISDLLMKQGFVHFLGVLLEPLMRPIFRLPGKASFIIAMTHTSGIPIGAILTCKMRNDGELSQIEGERLLAFTSNPSPGFMFGALASGMLGNPALGLVIVGSIYISNLIVGLLFRFYGHETSRKRQPLSVRQAMQEIDVYQKKNKKPIGEMLANAVSESTSTILMVGGFIVFFSVITHMLTVLNISDFLARGLQLISSGFFSLPAGNALIQGLLETTVGCNAAVSAFTSLNAQVGMLAFLLGWGGISVFAQVASFTSTTDLRFLPFVIGRILHAFLALITSQILLLSSKIPTMTLPASLTEVNKHWLLSFRWSFVLFCLAFSILLFIGLALRSRSRRLNKHY